MKNRLIFNILSALLLSASTTFFVFAQPQNLTAPKQEKLLNGLKVLMWNDAKAEKVSVKIRVHSGTAFDPQGKEGVMQMLADNIFPTEPVREFFTDDLGGSLEMITNHDFIQINATAKNEEFLTMLETLANAVTKPTIDKETTAKLRAARIEKLKETEKNAVYIADQAVAKRLLGTFPYGRPTIGTTESLQQIDYADLIFAKDRFFTADNATVVITGNFKPELAFRAARRYFGAWTKSESRVPSSFKQPDEPDTKAVNIKSPFAENSEIRYALRGLARNDKDYAASKILTKILQYRLQKSVPAEIGRSFQVRYDEHILPGLLIIGYTSQSKSNAAANVASVDSTGKSSNSMKNPISSMLTQNITAEEFTKAKANVTNEINLKPVNEWWLDLDTYRLASVAGELQSFETASLADVQRVAEKLSKNPVVTLSVTQTGEATSAAKN